MHNIFKQELIACMEKFASVLNKKLKTSDYDTWLVLLSAHKVRDIERAFEVFIKNNRGFPAPNAIISILKGFRATLFIPPTHSMPQDEKNALQARFDELLHEMATNQEWRQSNYDEYRKIREKLNNIEMAEKRH